MLDSDLFRDVTVVQIVTPYARLRKLRGWSQEKAAEVFHTNKHAIVDIEAGRRDPGKQLIRTMDTVFGCKGRLIAYWLAR